MKKVRIGIMPEERIRKYVMDVTSGKIKPNDDMPKIWCTSIESACEILNQENVDLLILMDKEKPATLSELSDLSGYSVRHLVKELNKLWNKGFVSCESKVDSACPEALYTTFEIVMGKELEDSFDV